MRETKPVKTIKIKPLYSLLFIGIGQIYGAFTIYRLGVLTVKETWINQVCIVLVFVLIGWAIYLFYSFSMFFRLKDNKIILREDNLSLFGVELSYSDIEDFGINASDSELSMDISIKDLDEPIPIVSKFMKLKDFHMLTKTLIEKTTTNQR
ncbi:hypothetical protein [Flagellimonas pacifica]|uniref:Uncharacterized protein n=1 Tax=Flagellimonas pacifica TaxID=1247520 RepID=A0A285MGY6_9FLAO|nr:hypothetical protein [Allomuricauda parva]SNY94741.1 hypothetical protein SAMN06265377_0401 [Allomuricauda parva]